MFRRNILRPELVLVIVLWSCWLTVHPAEGQDKYRSWSSKDGKVQIKAKFIQFVGDRVRLERPDGSQFTTDPQNLSAGDQQYLQSMGKPGDSPSAAKLTLPAKLRNLERKTVRAVDFLKSLEDALRAGNLDAADKTAVQQKIAELKPLAAKNGLHVEGEYLSPAELDQRKAQAATLVDEWIQDALASQEKKIDIKRLRDATKLAPVSTEAAILSGMVEYFAHGDPEKASRHFSDAVKRGRRYETINSLIDNTNLSIAMNAAAVAEIRDGNFFRALDLFAESIQKSDIQAKQISANISRFHRMARFSSCGIDLPNNKAKLRQLLELKTESQKYYDDQSLSTWFKEWRSTANLSGLLGDEVAKLAKPNLPAEQIFGPGWSFPSPVSSEGQVRDLGFIVRINQVVPGRHGLIDHNCLVCDGSQKIRCRHEACQKGKVTIKKKELQNTPAGKVYIDKNLDVPCPQCKGVGIEDCASCGKGSQFFFCNLDEHAVALERLHKQLADLEASKAVVTTGSGSSGSGSTGTTEDAGPKVEEWDDPWDNLWEVEYFMYIDGGSDGTGGSRKTFTTIIRAPTAGRANTKAREIKDPYTGRPVPLGNTRRIK